MENPLPELYPLQRRVSEPSQGSLDRRKVLDTACSRPCPCRCHIRTFFHLRSSAWEKAFGSISIGAIGNPFQKPHACNEHRCKQRSLSLLSVLYNSPNWFYFRALALVFVNGDSPRVTLYFPRVIPPDASIAVSIRKGDCDRIKDLIASGDASPFDIIGPYSLTALHLAISYGQIEVCNLLTTMGAHNYPVTISDRIGDIISYWTRFRLFRCSSPGTDIIEDLFHLCALDNYIHIIRAIGPTILGQVD